MKDLDYQWPSSFQDFYLVDKKFSSKLNNHLINKIEDFFSKFYNCYVCLMPSGRSSISILLRYLNFDRSKTVFISKWSSQCLYSCISPYTNVSTDFADPDLILAIHKWGYISDLSREFTSKLIIEDSVDSIHIDNSLLFQNNGIVEIISLPKIIGSLSGGLVLTRDKNIVDFIKSTQQTNLDFAASQSKKKYKQYKNSFSDWEHLEHINTSLDIVALNDIEKNLHNLKKNIKIISNRRETVFEKFTDLIIESNRLGPVLVFPHSRFKVANHENKFMVRQFNYSEKIDVHPAYESSYLLPIHFGISDEYFQSLLNSIIAM